MINDKQLEGISLMQATCRSCCSVLPNINRESCTRVEMQGQSTSTCVQADFERWGKSLPALVLVGQCYVESQVVAQVETKMYS